jgi:hypothetical protein
MAYKLIEAAQARWRAVNAPHLVALVRAGATFVNGNSSNDPMNTLNPKPPKRSSSIGLDSCSEALPSAETQGCFKIVMMTPPQPPDPTALAALAATRRSNIVAAIAVAVALASASFTYQQASEARRANDALQATQADNV